jgi:multiple sugar transport system permease protein
VAAVAQTPDRRRIKTVGSEGFREALVGYGFIALPIASFLIFFIYPLGYAAYISFFDWGALGKISNVGLDNYKEAYHDFLFHKALKNTLLYSAVVVPCQMALGLTLAVTVNQALRFRGFFRAAFYFPAIAGSIAITAIATYLLASDGLLNALIGWIKGSPYDHSWFGESSTALWSIMGLNIWTTSGTMMLFYLAYLQAIPTDVYEAAVIDGAGAWRTFWKITFPLLKPGHFFVAVLSVIGTLQVFDQAFFVSGGGGGPNYSTTTIVLYLYRSAINDVRFGYAAAVGIILFAIIFTLTVLQRLVFGRAEVA